MDRVLRPSRREPGAPARRATVTSTRIVPWQPASTPALDGSITTANTPCEQLGSPRDQLAEAVPLGFDLFAVVEDVGDVPVRLSQRCGQPQRDGDATLHVAGAEPVDQAVRAARRQVVVQRHRVEVAGDHDPLVPAEFGTGDDRVAVPRDGQVRVGGQGRLDRIRQTLLGATHRGDVDERDGQVRARHGQIEVGHQAPSPSTVRRQENAELVALRIGADVPADLVVLGPQQCRTRVQHRLQLGRRDVPVDPVLHRLRLGHRLEHPVGERQPRHVLQPVPRALRVALHVTADHRGPPARLRPGVGRVDHQLHQLVRRHAVADEAAELTTLGIGQHRPVLLVRDRTEHLRTRAAPGPRSRRR